MITVFLALAIAVQSGNNMPLVEASVDGVECTLLLDTGASHTTLDLDFVTKRLPNVELKDVELIGSTNVATPPKFVAVKEFKLGEEIFAIEGMMTLDLSHLSAGVGKRVDGILGINDLRRKPCLISLKRGELIWGPTKEEVEGFHRVLTRDRGTTFELIVKLPSGEITPMLIDTGSSFTFLDRRLWKASADEVRFGTSDVNDTATRGFVRGEKGVLNCGRGFKLEVAPILTEETNRNQLGSDVFQNTDILVERNRLSLR